LSSGRGGIAFGTISTGTSASSALTVQGVTGGGVAIGSVAVGGTGAGAGVAISGNTAAVSIGAISVAGSAGDALQITGNSGAVSVGAVSVSASGGDGVELSGNSDTVALGALSSSGAAGAGLNLQNILGNVTVGSASISGGATGVSINGVGAAGTVTIAGLAVSGSGTGVALADVDGAVSFTGTTSISNPGTSGIVIGAGSAGTISFGDVDITGLGAGTTGVYARDASGTISFNTLDITGSSTTGTRGIDLTGATFATNFTTTESGSITGVGIGVDLTNAAITGSFRYGDGSNTDADGAASSINAVTPIVITGINVGAGSYNFLDVALTGDTSTLTSSATLYFVKAGATGVGTIADPGSLAGAEASAADTIILLNDPTGGQDILDAAGAGGSFDLAAGRKLLSFLNGDTLMLPGGAPANLLLFGIPSGQIGNPFAGSGAPVLTTTTAGANTVTLGGSTTIDGVIIQTGVGGGAGVFGSGVANVLIRNSNISGEGGAIHLIDNGAAASVALSNLTLSSTGGNVVELDGSGAGSLAVTALSDITIAGDNGETGGFVATDVLFDADLAAAGVQTVIGSLTVGAAGARLEGVGASITGDGSIEFTNLQVVNLNSYGVNLFGNAGLTAVVRAGSIDTVDADALVAQNAALTLDFNTITTSAGGGIYMDGNTAADAGAPVLNVRAMNLSGGMSINGAGGDYVFANASITDNVDVAVRFGGTVNIDYAGDISSGAGASATIGTLGHSGGTVTFHDGTIDATGGAGLQFHNADGIYSFTGTTMLHGGDAGIHVANGSSGSFFFGAGTSVTNGAVANFMLENSDANVTYLGSLTQGLNTDNFVVFGQTGGVVDFSQATISASAGSGLVFLGADGTSMLGDVQLSGGAGIEITGSGAISFDNVDITGVGANQTAVDLTGALGNVTFLTLDIAGASTVGSTGIDLSGSTTAANITVIESSSITGVGIGVDLTNAAITGNFRYGDGSSTDADGAASTISAGVPIEITGLNGATGTYDFADVNLIGDTSRLTTSATTYFVADGAAGVGTMADPGSLAGAEASGAQFIILLNDPNGGPDTLDAASAGGSFDLAAGQSLLGFLNGDTLTLPGGGPTNLVLFGLTPGQIVNPFAASGAPVLTNSTGADTLILASNTLVDGILINAPNGRGIFASDAANVTIRNSNISAGSNAIMLMDGAAGTSASLRNLQLAANSGAVLELDGTGLGALTLTALDQITVAGGNGELFGIYGSGVTFDADLTTAGFQTVSGTLDIGSVGSRVTSTGIFLIDTEGTAAFDLDVATDGGSGVLVQGTPGALRFDITGGTIDALNSTGYGLYLANASADVVLSSITYAGAGTAVSIQNVTGAGPLGRAIDVATLTVADGAASAIAMSGSATGSFSFGAGSSIGTTTGAAISLSNTGASTFNYAGSVNYAGVDAVLSVSGGHSGTVNFTGAIDATSGTGLVFDDADGTYNFTGSANMAAGIGIFNGSAGSFSFGADTTIVSPGGIAVDIQDSTASVGYAGTISYGSAGLAAINVVNHSGGTIDFTGLIDITTGTGINFDNADGTYNFTGTTGLDAGSVGIVIANGSAGDFTFGADTNVIVNGGSALAVSSSTATIAYLGYAYALAGNGISVTDHSVGTIDFSGATLDLNGGTTLRFDNADGNYSFGSFATAGGSGIAILNGSAGGFTFGDIDIADLGAGQTAVDLTGATGNVTFQTLDITGTGGTGIDLSGSTTTADIIVNESSTITGVGVGVDLTNAAITGNFRYGDGSSTDADGAASSISAVTPLVIAGLNPGGTYDFADVVLTGDTSTLQTNKTVFWVQAGATGAGTRTDPGSLAAAEASGVDVIILLDAAGAGQDVIDGASAGGGLDLAANQSLLSFLNGDTLSIGGGAPANLLLYGIVGGSVTNPYAGSGAPLLTTSQAGATTVNLASGALIDGVQIGNLDWKGVYGGYLTDVTIRNSVIFGGVNAIEIVGNGGSAALSNLDLSSATGDVLRLRGDGGDLIVTQLANLTIHGGNSGRGLFGEQLVFDASVATAGIQRVVGALDIGSSASRVGGAGLVLDDVTGALELTTNVYNTDGDGIFADGGAGGFTFAITGGTIDTGLVTTAGSALNLANLSTDLQLDSVTYSGLDSGVLVNNVTGVGTGGRALDIDTLTVASGAASGISLLGTTSGNFSFGGASSITGTTVAGIAIANSGAGTFSYDGSLTAATGALISVSGGDIDTATFSGALNATGGTGLQFDNADGTYNFTGTTTLNGGDAGVDIVNGSSGTFTFGTGTSITSPSGTGLNVQNSTAGITYSGNLTYATAGQFAVEIVNHTGGTITFQTGTLGVTNGSGVRFDNADGTYAFTGTATLSGVTAGFDIGNGSSGTFNFGSGTSVDATLSGLGLANSAANVTYAGTLTSSAGYAFVASSDQSTLDISSATLNVTGLGLNFNDADGVYTFGSFALSNGASIVVANDSGGTLTFGDVDITGTGAGQSAVNLVGAVGDVTFNTLDITGTSTVGSRGINLFGNTGTGDIVVTNSSTITGVGIGVDLTNASRTGLFQYGDGESAIDVASTITATTPLVIAGLNGGTGTYNFADVNLVGDTSGLATTATVYYVLAGASGSGTLGDPGSLAGAEAAAADIIILLNNPTGGQDVLDALGSNGNDTLQLDINQALRSFRDSNTIALPGGAPANVILTGVVTGQVVNPYAASAPTAADRAPILTTTGAANTVTLANNSLVDGMFVQSAAGFAALYGSGVSGVTLSGSTLFGAGGGLSLLDGGAAASATLTGLTVSVTSSTAALDLSGAGAGTLTVTGSGLDVTQGGSGQLVSINDIAISAGGLSFGTTTATASGGGVDLLSIAGAGPLSFTSIALNGTTGAGVLLQGSSAAVNLGTVTVAGATGAGIELASNSGAITLGTVNVSGSATGIAITGQTNTLAVGDGTIAGASIAGILFGAGNTGTITFGDVDITGLQTGARGVDARNIAAGDITFATLDITGASAVGTRGIDVTGNAGAGDFIVTNSSAITGVGVGVDLTNASRTGLLQYGDGESVVDVASAINATTPILITGLNGAIGTYNFADVALAGDTSGLATSATVYYVLAGATGVGTLVDPGSLAGAEAATADFIILLNDPTGGQDVLDALGTNGNDTLALDVNQILRSFRDGNTITLPGGAPANVIVTGVMTGQVTNPYAASALTPTDRAPILTTTGADNTVTLANNSLVDGVFVQSASGSAGVFGSGKSGVTISNATIFGPGHGLLLLDGGAAASATLTNLNVSSSGSGTALGLAGNGAGTLTVAGSGINVSHSGLGALLAIDDIIVDGANLSFGTVTSTTSAAGVDLGRVAGLGTLSFGSITVAGASGSGVALHNSSAIVNLGDVTVSGAVGAGIQLTSNSGATTIGTIDISSSATGIAASGLTSTLTVGDGTIDGATTAGILIGAGNTVLLDFGNIDITALQTGARGVDARLTGGSNVFFETLDISGASAIGTRGIDLTGNTASAGFIINESSTITGVGIGVDLTNASRTGTFRYGDGSNIDFDLAASTINAATPIVIAGLNGATGTYDFRDATLVGDTSPLEVSAFFVRAGATGVGSRSDPGSLAAADASTASFIVLLDTQAGAGSFDTISGTLTLANNQSLLSFRDTDTFNVGGGAPPNVFVFNVTTGTITNPNSGSGAPLLTSADATGTVQLGGTSVIDGVVVSNTGTGAGIFANGNAGTATIRNSTISGGGAAIDLRSGAFARIVNLQNLSLANAGNQPGALLNLNGTGGTLTVTGMSNLSIGTAGGETAGLVFNTVTFDSDLATGGIQAVNAGALTIGTTGARVQGDGLSLTNVSGSLTFSDLDIANTGGTGLLVANSKANSFLLTTADGSYDTTFGTAVNLDPLTVNMTLSSVTATNGAYGIQLDQVEGFFIVTGAVNVTNATIAGIAVENNTGQADALDATFNGAVTINNTVGAGLSLTNNAGATIIFGGGGTGVDVVTTGGAALNASGGTLSIAGSGNSLTSGTGQTMALSGLTVGAPGINFGSVSANGAATAVVLTGVTATGGGAINLDTVNLQGITSRGIDVNTALGAALSITDLDIGLNGTTAVAVDLNGAALTAGITANDFDVTNAAAAGTSIAVDLRGTTGGQVVRLGDSVAGGGAATIAGVNTGVWLDATTNAAFTYGDGEAAIDSASTISAGTGINAASAPAVGTYNFTDVTFGASPGLGFGVGRTWFVDSDGVTGGGNGSGADGANPMTLAAAELALAATDVIVLVNNSSAISAAGSNANDTLNLLANTQVRGFGQGPLALTLVVPSTIQLSSSTINIADPTGNGAATLTSAAGASVITLGANGNRISGFILDGAPAGALRGIVDVAGATGTVIDFMTIRNFNQPGGYGIEITPSTNTTIDNVTFTGNTNDVLLNAAGSTITNVTATGATGTSITLDNATGTTTLTNVAISGAATGLSFTNAGGTINAANVDINGAATSALTISGGTASFTFDGSSSIVQAAGGLTLNVANHSTGTLAFAGLINATSGSGMQFNNADGTYNFPGITTLNGGDAGIDIYNGATGTFTFGTAASITHNGAGNAFVLLSSANVTFDGSITDNDGTAVEIDAHDAGTATFNGSITSSIANASKVISITNSNGGAINFNGAMNIASTGAQVVDLSSNNGGTITFNAGGSGLDITSTTGTGMRVADGGTVNVLGSGNSITTGSGTLLNVTDTGGTATNVNLSFASAANTSGANGIVVQRTGAGSITGTINVAAGASPQPHAASRSPATRSTSPMAERSPRAAAHHARSKRAPGPAAPRRSPATSPTPASASASPITPAVQSTSRARRSA
jgi:hypothetical protein